MFTIEVDAYSPVPPERVWALLADAATWSRWGPFDEVAVEQGSGVGEIRRIRSGRTTTRELITRLDAPRTFGYELLSGLPIRNYAAEVTLEPDQGGTTIRWRSRFESKVPGTGKLIQRRLEGFLSETATGLARAAADENAA